MNTLKSIFAILILIVLTPVYASEDDNPLRIENLTSISSIVNPATLELAKSVNAAPEWRNFIPPQAFWSPDGSKLLIRSTIGWYKDDINFHPSNRNGIGAIYVMDSDGTNLTKIVSNEINNRSKPIEFPSSLSWSPSGDKIAITVYRNFYLLANPDGKGLIALGTNFSDIITIITNLSELSRQKDLIWSPDGTKAVFVVNDPDKIYITDADGSNIKQLAGEVNEPFLKARAWSHDGERIAFSGRNLWIMNSDGTNLRQFGDCWGGVWSPDDSKVLCMSSEEVNDQYIRHLYLINLNSGDKTEITKSVEVGDPAWNPDSNNILFVSLTERRNLGIFVYDSQGRSVKLIYEENNPLEKATLISVSWSPDGSKITFTVSENGIGLYTINPDGTGKILISSNLTGGYAWSPSGDKIAFSSSTANGEHIFIANPDGTERTQITTGENKHYVLSGMGGSWSPDGSRLLIESSTYRASRNEVFIAKLSGYGRTMPTRVPGLMKQGEEKRSPEPNLTVTPETTKSITAATTPEAPGFDGALAVAILSAIYLFKRRYN
ncbi:MAG: PD40 domain-containing protein [Candidatus Methanoperedenaceae archaeon]|nr:PD40 domain-containing protein [Candidatus Methanoperedenaceae archaeon]